jgi:hypothetical protein
MHLVSNFIIGSFVLTLIALMAALLLCIWWVRTRKSRSATDGAQRLLAASIRLLPKERREWGVAMLAELAQLQNSFTRWQFALGCTRVALFAPRKGGLLQIIMNNTIKNITTNPQAAAFVGFLLALPVLLILSIALFEIEPFQGFLKPLFTEANSPRNSTFGIIFLIVCLLLLPVALIINLVPIVRSVQAGNSILANPVNFLLVAALLSFMTTLVGGFVIDQYPCWIGVPNCD